MIEHLIHEENRNFFKMKYPKYFFKNALKIFKNNNK